MPPVKRKKIFVNSKIQGSVLLRFAAYWALYHFVLWHTLFLFHFMQYRIELLNGGDAQSLGQVYWTFCEKYCPMVISALVILPLLLHDSLRTTHRIAGPLVRFKNTLQQLRRGEHVESIKLRDRDLLVEFQKEFNEFLAFYNRQLAEFKKSTATEEQTLNDVNSLLDEVSKRTTPESGELRETAARV